MNLRVLVTGATGFIGRLLVRSLLEQGYYVSIVTRDPSNVPPNVAAQSTVIHTTIDAVDTLEPHLRQNDVVLHLAAFIPPDLNDPKYNLDCLTTNAMGTLRLLEAAQAAGINQFVYYSSGNMYRYKASFVREDDCIYPARHAPYYLGSKMMGELYVEHFRLARNMKTTVLRLSSVYGPYMKRSEVVARFLFNLFEREPIELHSGGQQTADFLYVDDVFWMTHQVLLTESTGVFNVGSGQATSLLELANILLEVTGANADLMNIHPPTRSIDQSQGFGPLDVSRATELLGYQPTKLKQGLESWLNYVRRSPSH